MKNIIDKYKYNIGAIIRNFTGSKNEDIEQEVYIKVWKNLETYSEKNKFTQWINTITANTCRDYLKSKSHKIERENYEDDEELNSIKDNENRTPEAIIDKKDRQKAVLKAVDKLPKKMKEVIILYEFESRSYEEISKRLNIPTGTVRSRLSNARSELKEALKYLIGE